MGIIYETKGAAREYAPLACNYYPWCTHGCRYCYGPGTIRKTKEAYFSAGRPKDAVARRVTHSCRQLIKKGDTNREILLSFIGDPYQPEESGFGLTREVIHILADHGLPFTVLTKGGSAAAWDFDLLEASGRARFGTSLVWWDDAKRKAWEPGAKSVKNRVMAIAEAKRRGIPTWVSMEPVIDPAEALRVIQELHGIVDCWAIGKINHMPEIERGVDWRRFRAEAEEMLSRFGSDYFFKSSLDFTAEAQSTQRA